ncbi:MAG: mycothiol biosynthesis acetyltransferase [Actinomycetia bacterium]|nr:mycothiol biosynthesis acetyltransferase [Actinomycetes bacterium]
MAVRDVIVREQATEQEIDEVLRLVEAAARHDGVQPLSEHSLLSLRHGGKDRALSLLLVAEGIIVGYGHLDLPTDTESAAGELVVHPEHRRRGHGRALAGALLTHADGSPATAAPGRVERAGERTLRVWAHGELPAAVALAHSLGFVRMRALLQLRRPLAEPLPEVTVPAGVRIRTFESGRDEQAWVRVNARAFAHHPEQGAWTVDDLLDREAEAWFDPSGFFLAERDGELAGFHWTKVHPGEAPVGEVYVIGVDPGEQGTGLGRALTLTGLHHLRSLGLSQVMLYVDEDNAAAVRLYESLGFVRWDTDVMYRGSQRAEGV